MEQYFETFLISVPTVVIVFEFIKGLLKLDDAAAQIGSWLTAFAVAILAHFAGWGVWAEFAFSWELVAWAIGLALAANKVFDAGLLKAVLGAINFKE